MLDLFRPFMAREVPEYLARVVTPDADGRVYVGTGPRVQEFEEAFGKLVGSPFTPLALNSCTSALDLALHLAGVGLGSEVITSPMNCIAGTGVIVNRGAKIVWADVDPVTGLIDPADVARKITKRTRAIMAVDWAGRSCDYHALKSAALPVIQDAAHHLMADMTNRGTYTCWSLQAIKHLSTGDGGVILVPLEQRKRARLLSWYGLDRESSADYRCDQDIKVAGYKYGLNDVAASIGLANLPHAAWVVQQHRRHAERYHRLLADAPGITLPPPDPASSWWLYCVLVNDRDSFRAHMAECGVATSPVHARNDKHSAFQYYNGPLPGVDSFATRECALPVGWWLSDEDIDHIASAALEWAHSRRSVKELVHAS